MTREEAREILTHNWTRVDNPNYSESELDEAVDMAITALQQEEHLVELEAKAVAIIKSERHGEWIRFEDYLPRRKQRVIFLEQDNASHKYNIDLGMFCWKDEKESDYSDSVTITNRKWHATDSRIIAWCPLPPFELATNCGAKMDKE